MVPPVAVLVEEGSDRGDVAGLDGLVEVFHQL